MLNEMISNSVEVAGSHPTEFKEDAAQWFTGRICNCQLNKKYPWVKLAACGSPNTPKKDDSNIILIPQSARSENHNQEGQRKTENTCSNITSPINSDGISEVQSNEKKSTQLAGPNMPPVTSPEKSSKIRRKNGAVTIQTKSLASDSGNTESLLNATTKCSLNRAESAQSVPSLQVEEGSTLTTAIRAEECADYCAQTAISVWVNSMTTQAGCCAHPNTLKRTLVSKPEIFGFGLNFQHCHHQTFFPSHSFEQLYQAIRRSWRFGQKHPVTIDLITSEGEQGVLKNVMRKSHNAELMFANLVRNMGSENHLVTEKQHKQKTITPSWLS